MIFLSFTQHFMINQIENNVAEILGVLDAPMAQDRNGHWPELMNQKFAGSDQKLLAGDMGFAFEFFLREGQSVHDENISIGFVARIFLGNTIDNIFEILIHGCHVTQFKMKIKRFFLKNDQLIN